MSRYLITTIETYRFDTEEEAQDFLNELKELKNGEILKHSIEYKEQKSKGEVIQSWYRLTIKRQYNEEKEPIFTDINIS